MKKILALGSMLVLVSACYSYSSGSKLDKSNVSNADKAVTTNVTTMSRTGTETAAARSNATTQAIKQLNQ